MPSPFGTDTKRMLYGVICKSFFYCSFEHVPKEDGVPTSNDDVVNGLRRFTKMAVH